MAEMEQKSQEFSCGYVGIDLGKKRMAACRLGGTIERQSFNTDGQGERDLVNWLRSGDLVALEAGNQAFRIAKNLMKAGFSVIVLNPGDVATIYKSMKKTDREDALKLARLISRIPVDELPTVAVPSDDIEDARRLLREEEFWCKQITALKNRLHSLFVQAGITDVRKEDLVSAKHRKKFIEELPQRYRPDAGRIDQLMLQNDEALKTVKKSIKEILKKNRAYTYIAMSIPGIGTITALAFYAFIEDGSRFSSVRQIAYYTGLVPRVDISGDTKIYGKVTKRGAHLLRRSLVQAAWSLTRSNHGGELKRFYEKLYPRIGKKKAIVATARKMAEVFYTMIRNGTTYYGVPDEVIEKKMKAHGVI